MGKRVTLQMIADQAGVSVVTVSNVLSGRKGAGEEVRSRVNAIAKELGYSREKKAGGEQTYRIGVLIAERYVQEYPSYYMNLYRQVAQEASVKGCLTILDVVSEERERLSEAFRAFDNGEADGILVIGEMSSDFLKRLLEPGRVPVVCLDFYDVGLDMDFIITNSFRGMSAVTDYLIQCGHRELLFLGDPAASGSIMDRYMGFCKSLRVHGLPETAPIPDRERGPYGTTIQFELPEKLPDAFVCNCERTAIVLAQKLRKRGVRIPEDVSAAAFDRFQEKDEGGLEFVTYESDESAMSQISISTLIRRLKGDHRQCGIRTVEGAVAYGNTVSRR